ncbi:hypothetical protein [Neolewinella sp.]|uniref:hypothetical protein n=1 Tax=Neolewinella sp. TaxID=2993543 RepID=UPI003B525FFA
MSRLLPLALFFGLLLFAGCPGPDEPQDDFLTESDFYGTWVVDRFDSDFTTTGTFLGQDLDQEGSSSISNSGLELSFRQDGSWSSSGDYDLNITTENGTEVTRQRGIGQGSWSYRLDTLFMDGLQNYNGAGTFSLAQPCVVDDFERDIFTELSTQTLTVDRNDEFETELVTRGSWEILIKR